MSFKKVTHVIFDFDGLIIDSEAILEKEIDNIAAKFGKQYTNDVRLKILGTPETATAQLAVSLMGLPCTPQEFLEIFVERVKTALQHPDLMSGVKKLIQHLHKHNIPMAIATSSSDETMTCKTQDHQDLMAAFHHVVCGSSDKEVKNGKPAPDIYLVCASRFPDNPKPDQCLVFEDAPNGARGAVAAGMQVVLVPSPDVPQEMRQPATLVLNSLTEFKPELFGLPRYEE